MKKFSSLMLCMTGFMLLNTGCDSSDDDNAPFVPEKESDAIDMKYVSATYTGEENGCGLFAFDFSTQPAAGANASGLYIELCSDAVAPEDLLDANITPGRYKVGITADKNVIIAGENSGDDITGSYYYTADAEGNVTKTPLTEGNAYFVISEGNKAAFISEFATDKLNNKWVSCQYNGDIEIEPVYDNIYTKQNGWYWGDDEYDFPGIGQYMSNFYDGELNGQELAEGTSISLSFYTDMAPKPWEAQIPEGDYVGSTEYGKGIILVATPEVIEEEPWSIYGYAMRQRIVDGNSTENFVVDVKAKVKRTDNGEYVMKFNMLLDNGERHISKYEGKVRQGDEFTKSSLTEPLTINPGFGYLQYVGPSPLRKGVNRWNIRLYTAGIKVLPDQYWSVDTNGEGEYITIEVYTDSHYTTAIPDGRYTIAKEELPYNAGMGQGGYGFNFGTWCYKLKNLEAPAVNGQVNVEKQEGDSNYKITFNFTDDRGNAITGSYNGELEYWTSVKSKAPAQTKAPASGYEAAKSAKAAKAIKAYEGK